MCKKARLDEQQFSETFGTTSVVRRVRWVRRDNVRSYDFPTYFSWKPAGLVMASESCCPRRIASFWGLVNSSYVSSRYSLPVHRGWPMDWSGLEQPSRHFDPFAKHPWRPLKRDFPA